MQIQLALSKTSTVDNKCVVYDKKIGGTQHAISILPRPSTQQVLQVTFSQTFTRGL